MTSAANPAAGVPNAPAWWTPKIDKSGTNTQFGNSENALLPYMSPSEQQSTASSMGNEFASAFGSYINTSYQPYNQNTPSSNYYLGATRAANALNTLNNMAGVAKQNQPTGSGYNYLTNVLNQTRNAAASSGGAEGEMSRQAFQNLLTALGTVQANTKLVTASKSMKPYNQFVNLANTFVAPTIGSRNMAPVVTTKAGKTTFGTPNPSLFE